MSTHPDPVPAAQADADRRAPVRAARGATPRASSAAVRLASGLVQPVAGSAVLAGEPLRKPVNALAIVPQSRRITPLFRKSYNVMLHLAQQQGIERDVYRAPVSAVLAGVDFDSNDTALVKRHLRAMATTAVEWQSPTTGEGAAWAISGLIGHAEIKRERGQNWLEWSYSVKLKQELLEPSVFARLSIEIIAQLRSHAAIALYEICSRYRDIGRSARQPWTWWRPVLSGKPETDKQKQLEYRFFKRDVLKKAVAEVNAVTDLEVELLEYKEGRFIADLQFLIRRKQAQPGLAARARAADAAGRDGVEVLAPGAVTGSAGSASGLPPARVPGGSEGRPEGLPHGAADPARRSAYTVAPVDLSLVVRAVRLGIEDERAEHLLAEHGEAALRAGLDTLEKRLASAYPEPLRDPWRYLRTVLAGAVVPAEPTEQAAPAARAAALRDDAQHSLFGTASAPPPAGTAPGRRGSARSASPRTAEHGPAPIPPNPPVPPTATLPATPPVSPSSAGAGHPATHPAAPTAAPTAVPTAVPNHSAPTGALAAAGTSPPARAPGGPSAQPLRAASAAGHPTAEPARRRNRWADEWLRQRRDRVAADIAALGEEAQQALCEALLADMQQRNVHPSIRKRLQTSGWQHAMVRHEMIAFYARASIGEQWDQPSAAELLQVAERMGDGDY